MRYLPLFLDLRDRLVVVVGGGTVAERKVALAREAGVRLRVVAPLATDGLLRLRDEGVLEHVARRFERADLEGARLVIAATGDRGVDGRVARAAAARGIPVNAVDDLELSTAILPAIIDRSPLVIAVSTSGTAPVLARYLRERIESVVDDSVGRLAVLLARWRERIKAAVPDLRRRRALYERAIHGPVAQRVRARDTAGAEGLLDGMLRHRDPAGGGGRVSIVGAGPGDPGLLTLNALRALQSADVILHDRLVSREILALARREAELVEVGKTGGARSMPQEQIHGLLAEHAGRGRHVVRLKGGDPFVFGRGGEELEFLRERGIPFEVVPGVTAALACAAYAGIPLTHRAHSAGIRFVTAHRRDAIAAIDWGSLAQGRDTLAIYMGVGTLPELCDELIRHGRSASTPAAVIENGTRESQRVLTGTLGDLAARVAAHAVGSPALVVVGDVAAYAETLHWFGSPPVTGGSQASLQPAA